jgi:deoxyadenosine/deoxycytidine kinase
MTIIFSIEGNIGSGKSTLISLLKENLDNFVYLPEPVDIWNEIKDKHGVTILEKYYEDNERYAFSFQMMAYISRLSQIKNVIKNGVDVLITERSVFTDYNIFAKMLYDSSKINEIEYLIYKKWFNEFIDELPVPHIIYIKTKPETCMERVKKRNRKGETIPLSYLQSCHDYHEKWINGTSGILELDGENQIDINKITEFVKNNKKITKEKV